MRTAHTIEQVRAAEAALIAQLPTGTLMRRAGYALAMGVIDFLGSAYGARVLLLVGSGDNGGDALFAGQALLRRGSQVAALQLADRVHGHGYAAFRGAGGQVVTDPIGEWDVVVDGIVGIGGRAGLKPAAAEVIASLGAVPIIAVDVPSGVGVNDGTLRGDHISAQVTITFGSYKPAHFVEPAASACGVIRLVEFGFECGDAPISVLERDDVRALLPRPHTDAHKYSRGVVGVRAGSATYPGAAELCVAGANCGLVGMVRYDGPVEVRRTHPEVVGPGRAQAWVVGSGSAEEAAAALARSVADDVPIVVDADALAHVGDPLSQAVLTPHAGELAALLGTGRAKVEAEQLSAVRDAAQKFDAVVMLKGPRTLIAHPDGRVRVNTTGTPWLATAGSGDVLAGLIGALLAAGLKPWDAASVGAWLHGAAAERIGGPVTANDLAAALPELLRAVQYGEASVT